MIIARNLNFYKMSKGRLQCHRDVLETLEQYSVFTGREVRAKVKLYAKPKLNEGVQNL